MCPPPTNWFISAVHVCFLQKLSGEEHFGDDDEHNPDYDHEAFLGDEAKEFDDLSPEESKERLA